MRTATRFVVLAAAATVACGESDPAPAVAQRWSLGEERVRIGSLDGESALSRVTDLGVGPDGRVYVLLPQEASVRVFDAGGSPVGRIGREGEGPGELTAPGRLGFLGDTLWVNDGRQRRVSLFALDGAFLGSVRHPSPQGVGVGVRVSFGALAGGGRAVLATSADFGGAFEGTAHPFPLLVADRDAPEPADTVATLYTEHDRAMLTTGSGGQITSIEIFQQIYSDVTLWTTGLRGDDLVLVDRKAAAAPGPHTYRVTRVSLGGDTLASAEVAYEPVAVPAWATDSILGRLGGGRRSRAELEGVLFLPPFYPPAERVLAAADGTIWVEREAVARAPTTVWDVFDGSGQRIATLQVPARLRLHHVSSSEVWGVVTDELDVPYVVRRPVVVQ